MENTTNAAAVVGITRVVVVAVACVLSFCNDFNAKHKQLFSIATHSFVIFTKAMAAICCLLLWLLFALLAIGIVNFCGLSIADAADATDVQKRLTISLAAQLAQREAACGKRQMLH